MPFEANTITFTPLARGRYRCNQYPVTLKKADLDGFRRHHANNGRTVAPPNMWVPPPIQKLEKVWGTYWGDNFWGGDFWGGDVTTYPCPRCEHSHEKQGKVSGEVTCDRCGCNLSVELLK